jgi:hypothetical protein
MQYFYMFILRYLISRLESKGGHFFLLPKDVKVEGEYKIWKSPTPEGKISIVLFTRLAELENDCNLTQGQGCRRFPYLVLFPVFDFISH